MKKKHHSPTVPVRRLARRTARAALTLLTAGSAALLAACNDDGEADTPDGPARRTVLVYAAAQNSLGSGGYLRADSIEMAAGSRYLDRNDRLLLFVDDGKGGARIYRFASGGGRPETVWQRAGETCSTSPETLREVLDWCVTAYPSEEYGLVFWSHASGWVPSTNTEYGRPLSWGVDAGTGGHGDFTADGRLGAQMNIEDLAGAIEGSAMRPLYVFFDACLMGGVETAYALRGATDCVVAAPIQTPAAGADYEHQVREGLFSTDPADIARTYFADVTDPGHAADYGNFGCAVAAIATAALPALADATADGLPYSALAGGADPEMGGVLAYAAYTSSSGYRPHAYDAAAAMRQLLTPDAYLRFRQALSEALLWHGVTERFYVGPGYRDYASADPSEACGLSMFVPRTLYTANAAACDYGDLNEAFRQTEWYRDAGWAATGW